MTLSLSLRLALQKVESDPAAVRTTLAGACDELALALDELRELARSLHPAVLSDRGLRAAVETLAGRVPVPVEVAGPAGAGTSLRAEIPVRLEA